MGNVNKNIKFLRKKFSLTQEQFANKVGIKRSLVGAYEEDRAEPRLQTLSTIADTFDISMDMIINRDMSALSEEEVKNPEIIPPRLKVLSITVDNDDNENIELIPHKASAGYLNGYADPEFMEELPKFNLPILPKNVTHRAFEISGDSMLPLPSGTVIIGQYIESVTHIKNGKTYVLLTQKEGVVYKRVFNYAEENNKLYLVSDNKVYSPYEVSISEVNEIWEAKAYISTKFPDGEAMSNTNLNELKSMVMDLQHEIIKIKNNK